MLDKYLTLVKVMLFEVTVEPQEQAIWNYVFIDTVWSKSTITNFQKQIIYCPLNTTTYVYLDIATYCGC
jgi:hypothetical protein